MKQVSYVMASGVHLWFDAPHLPWCNYSIQVGLYNVVMQVDDSLEQARCLRACVLCVMSHAIRCMHTIVRSIIHARSRNAIVYSMFCSACIHVVLQGKFQKWSCLLKFNWILDCMMGTILWRKCSYIARPILESYLELWSAG